MKQVKTFELHAMLTAGQKALLAAGITAQPIEVMC
jgi:phenylpyruvate tautomerase PptA (4-oxalocrotonate tautomerase family)